MIDRTMEAIRDIRKRAEISVNEPKYYWQTTLTAGITIAFFLLCSVGVVMGLAKVLFF